MESLVMRFMVGRLVVSCVGHRRVLCMVVLGWLLGGLVMSLNWLVCHNRDRHMMALNLVMHWFMLFMRNNMCLVVVMHYWSLMHNSGLMVHCNWLMSVLLICHEFLKEGLGHLDVFDMAA